MSIKNRKTITWEVNENGCHICTSHSLRKDGYMYIMRDAKRVPIHRHVYEHHYGKITTKGNVVRYSCDQRNCINPRHLSEGTHRDNVNDMMSRNRQAKGEEASNARISEHDAKMIKYFYKGWKHAEIAELYPIEQGQVNCIRRGASWSHI